MAVKVVQGLVGRQQADQAPGQNGATAASQLKASSGATPPQATQAAIAQAVQRAVVTSEAVVTSLRNVRGLSGGASPVEKIRDDREAKQVADDLAEKIREGDKGESLGAHGGLDGVNAGGSLLTQ